MEILKVETFKTSLYLEVTGKDFQRMIYFVVVKLYYRSFVKVAGEHYLIGSEIGFTMRLVW